MNSKEEKQYGDTLHSQKTRAKCVVGNIETTREYNETTNVTDV